MRQIRGRILPMDFGFQYAAAVVNITTSGGDLPDFVSHLGEHPWTAGWGHGAERVYLCKS